MKTTKPNWNMNRLNKMAGKGELRFDYPIQRAGGQWDDLQKSLLIHSIVADMPIPPIAIAKANVNGIEGEYVIDGKQRTTTVLDFMAGVKDKETGEYPSNAYPLHEDTPDLEIDGDTFELAGKHFDELEDDVKSELQSASFMIQRLEDATDETIEEIFNRWNNGTPLSKQQKARGKMGTANATIIAQLLSHPFMQDVARFSKLQRKRSDDEAVILQAMMLMSKGDSQLTSFVANDVLAFASEMRDADITDVAKAIKDALDYIYATEADSIVFKKLHLPTILVMAKKASDEGVDKKVFVAWVDDFAMAIDPRKRDKAHVKTKYKQYMGAGSVKKVNVLGRKKEMTIHFNQFIDTYELPAEEVSTESQEASTEPTETSTVVEPTALTEEQEKEAESLLDEVLA